MIRIGGALGIAMLLAGCGGDDGGGGGSGGSGGAAIGEPGTLWVTQTAADSISSIDSATLSVTSTKDLTSVGTEPTSIAVGAGSVWFTFNGTNQLSRMTAAGDLEASDVGGAYVVEFGEGAAWATIGAAVAHVDPTTGQSTAFIDTGMTQNSLAIGAGSVWVIGAGNLVRIDAATKAVTKEIDFQTGLPSALQLPLTTLAFGEGAVWIFGYTGSVTTGAHLLIKVDPASETVVDTAEIAVDGANDGVAAGLGSVWVSASLGEKLLRIDPATLDVVEEIAMPGAEPEDIALGNEIVWLTDWSNSTVWGVHATSKEIGSVTLEENPGGITFLAP